MQHISDISFEFLLIFMHFFAGVNSGVMLMNLTRMRQFRWGSYLWPLYQKYRTNITWGDQDIINIIFSMNPSKFLLVPDDRICFRRFVLVQPREEK